MNMYDAEPIEDAAPGRVRERLEELLDVQHLLTLSTTGEAGPWACTLAFAWDEDYDLYFVSRTGTRHVEELRADPRVAVALHAPSSDPDPATSRGLQAVGRATVLEDEDQARQALSVYRARFERTRGRVTWERLSDRAACVVRVRFDRLRYRDHEALGGRVEVPVGGAER